MTARTVVIIPAAGGGSRFGGEIPKQFVPLGGKPILQHAIERFLLDPLVARVIVAIPEPLLPGIAKTETERLRFVAGGETRQASVSRAMKEAGSEMELVAVHDAVRPFVTMAMFHAVLDAAREFGAAFPGIPVTDTIHTVSDGVLSSTLERSQLVAAQTPQCFRRKILQDVLMRAAVSGDQGTDEAGLAARYGFQVRVVPGDPANIKITRREDMMLAEAYLLELTQ
ncbi:MAG: 2-C-methyl-D-erythritol 4-phosphate cytidylyltransferase [Acidobacteriota bacterium]